MGSTSDVLPSELPRILIPFDAAEAISVEEASRIGGVSPDTIRRWAQLHNLGRRIGGRWVISRLALNMFLNSDWAALRALLAGDRSSPIVRAYQGSVDHSPRKPQTPQEPHGDADEAQKAQHSPAP